MNPPPQRPHTDQGAFRTMRLSKLKLGSLMLAGVGLLGISFSHFTLRAFADQPVPVLIRSAQSGPWSSASTWEDGKLPGAGVKVQVREGHTVVYDVKSETPIRSLHLAG